MPWYDITLEGFTVNNQTWDNILNVDGWADEVYIHADVRVIDQAGNLLLPSVRQSATMGDTNSFPNRVQAGSATARGGLRSGDTFPYNPPWERQEGLQSNRPPMRLFEGELTDDLAVAITPTIWEWDGGTDLFNVWGRSLVDNGPAIAAAVMNIIAAARGGVPLPTDLIKTNLETGIPNLFSLLSDIAGQARDRPIGMEPQAAAATFSSKSLVMTNRLAQLATGYDFGFGPGIIGIQYIDGGNLAGNYSLYIKIANALPLQDGSLVRERSSAPVYVVFGGARFWIPDPTWLERYGGWAAVTEVPDGALANVPAIPREGTVLREWSSAPVYVVQGGQKRWIPNPTILDRFGGRPAVRVVPDGGLAAIPDGPQVD
jgi:hypothetical protein